MPLRTVVTARRAGSQRRPVAPEAVSARWGLRTFGYVTTAPPLHLRSSVIGAGHVRVRRSDGQWRREVNQTGVFLGMHAVAPGMRDQGGGSIVVNISSAAGPRGDARIHAYVASKWAVRGMTKAAALELAPFGVRVNSVHPGLIQTPMSATEFESGKPDPGLAIPLRRIGQPEEVAELACFLASDASGYITGAEVAIDGAMTA